MPHLSQLSGANINLYMSVIYVILQNSTKFGTSSEQFVLNSAGFVFNFKFSKNNIEYLVTFYIIIFLYRQTAFFFF